MIGLSENYEVQISDWCSEIVFKRPFIHLMHSSFCDTSVMSLELLVCTYEVCAMNPELSLFLTEWKAHNIHSKPQCIDFWREIGNYKEMQTFTKLYREKSYLYELRYWFIPAFIIHSRILRQTSYSGIPDFRHFLLCNRTRTTHVVKRGRRYLYTNCTIFTPFTQVNKMSFVQMVCRSENSVFRQLPVIF